MRELVGKMSTVVASNSDNPILVVAKEDEFNNEGFPLFNPSYRVIAIAGLFPGFLPGEGGSYREDANTNLIFAEQILHVAGIDQPLQCGPGTNPLTALLVAERWPPIEAYKISGTGMDVLFSRIEGISSVCWHSILFRNEADQWCVRVRLDTRGSNFETWGDISVNPTLATFIIETFSEGAITEIPSAYKLESDYSIHDDEPDMDDVEGLKEWWEEEGKAIFEREEE